MSPPFEPALRVRSNIQSNDTQYDAIIIGSGMSGLTSAVILGKEGKKVLVLERHYRPGGYLHRFFRKEGVEWDVGFHYFGGVGRGEVLGRYFDYLDIRDDLDFIYLDPDGYDKLVFPDFDFQFPAGYEPFKERLHRAFPSERQAIETYVKDMDNICDSFAFYRRGSTENGKSIEKWMSTSLQAYLKSLTPNFQLHAVLSGQNPLYGVEPSKAPVGLHALVGDSFVHSPCTVRGGGAALANVMVKKIRSLGGTVKLKREVTEILVDDERRVSGVRTARGEQFEAPLVISCAHPKVTLELLPQSVLRPGYRRRVLGMEDGIGTLSVFATTKADLSSYGRKNHYLYKTYDLESLYRKSSPPNHRFAFVTVPSAREGIGKGGLHQAIGLGFLNWESVAKWAESKTGERGEGYEEFKRCQGEELLELMCELLPELKGRVETLEVATPLTNRDYTQNTKGAAYGVHHSMDQTGRYSIRPRTRVGGLYLTGQSVLMPGVCGVTISAFHTCSHILGNDYLMRKVNDADAA